MDARVLQESQLQRRDDCILSHPTASQTDVIGCLWIVPHWADVYVQSRAGDIRNDITRKYLSLTTQPYLSAAPQSYLEIPCDTSPMKWCRQGCLMAEIPGPWQ